MRTLTTLCILTAFACTSDARRPSRDSGMGSDTLVADATMGMDTSLPDAGEIRDANGDLPAVIWAHSGRELFRFDPTTNQVTSVGILDATDETIEPGPDGLFFSMTDLAVRSDGAVYGLGRGKVWRINTNNAMATSVVDEVRGVAMSFVPAGELGDSEELVIGYEDDADRARLARVDLETGMVEDLATFSGDCETSGDIASIVGLGTFITLRCQSDDSQDFLARLDVTDASIEIIGPTGVSGIWGLGFWAGVFYGFTNDGKLVSINQTTGRATVVANDIGSMDGFWGAGVTPDAPLI